MTIDTINYESLLKEQVMNQIVGSDIKNLKMMVQSLLQQYPEDNEQILAAFHKIQSELIG